jgi:ATP-dependent RNA helicase DDX20
MENKVSIKAEIENETKQRTADIHVAEEFTFNKFMLSSKLLKTLAKLNFVKPSPIQLKVMPLAKCGMDMIIQAKSGTGKTLAFSICLLENYDSELKFPQALVVVPTREIAVQIVAFLNDLGGSMKHFKACEFIGGTDVSDDRKKIQSSKIVVGTPGRIYHLIKNDVFNISSLRTVVLDEADKLLESGKMAKDVMSILKLMNRKNQIIAATATVSFQFFKVLN